jgi:hypothetical protein
MGVYLKKETPGTSRKGQADGKDRTSSIEAHRKAQPAPE